ncbi:hypothetical protein AWV79_20675 [Cupriavidus sp. UYMMa02A]|nr:hypothetical protein AWV79_20675 [Cupriavidus sp. UYMMa02A]
MSTTVTILAEEYEALQASLAALRVVTVERDLLKEQLKAFQRKLFAEATRDAVLAFMAAQGEADYLSESRRDATTWRGNRQGGGQIHGAGARTRLRSHPSMAGREWHEHPRDCRAVWGGYGHGEARLCGGHNLTVIRSSYHLGLFCHPGD